MVALEVRDLYKTYSYVRALQGLSFTLQRGEVLGFIGPNGAGKTTTIKIITGLVIPDKGAVMVDGQDVLHNPYVRKGVGYVPELPNAPPWARVCDFLVRVAGIEGVPEREARLLARRALERLGVDDLCNRKFRHTSKGQKKRILLAHALMTPKQYVLMDEPITGLDPEWVAETRKIIYELRSQGAGVLVSSHILKELEEIVDRVIIITRGTKVFEGTLQELAEKAGTGKVVVVRPSSVEAALRVLEQAGLTDVEVVGNKVRVFLPEGWTPTRLISLLEESGVLVHEFEYSESRLEDAYLRLVRGGGS